MAKLQEQDIFRASVKLFRPNQYFLKSRKTRIITAEDMTAADQLADQSMVAHGIPTFSLEIFLLVTLGLVVYALFIQKCRILKQSHRAIITKKHTGLADGGALLMMCTPECHSHLKSWDQFSSRMDLNFSEEYPEYAMTLKVLPQVLQSMTDKQLEARASRSELRGFDDVRTKPDRVSFSFYRPLRFACAAYTYTPHTCIPTSHRAMKSSWFRIRNRGHRTMCSRPMIHFTPPERKQHTYIDSVKHEQGNM